MRVVGVARICVDQLHEAGIQHSIRGRLLTPAFFHGDTINGWSMFLLFNEKMSSGTCRDVPISLLVDEKAHELLKVGSEFEFLINTKPLGHGKILSVTEVSDEEFFRQFKFDIWPGSMRLWVE